MRELGLSQSKTRASQDKLIIVVVIALFVHEMSDVIYESEVHTCNEKAFSMNCRQLILSFHKV
jgi:hypothetical protein